MTDDGWKKMQVKNDSAVLLFFLTFGFLKRGDSVIQIK
jgi:hypothetical protein